MPVSRSDVASLLTISVSSACTPDQSPLRMAASHEVPSANVGLSTGSRADGMRGAWNAGGTGVTVATGPSGGAAPILLAPKPRLARVTMGR